MKMPQIPSIPNPGLPPELAVCLMEWAPIGILIREGSNLVWGNHTLLEYADTDRDELLAASGEGSRAQDGRLAALFGHSERILITRRNGELCCLERFSVTPEDTCRTIFFFRNVTREAELEDALEHFQQQVKSLETHDPETGLLNRQGVMAALDRQVARSRRYGNALAVIRLILEAPHQPADEGEILRELSQEFRARLRWADELGRLNRNSFLLVLPETTGESAQLLIAKIHDEGAMPPRRNEGWVLTAVSTIWEKGDDRRRLLRRVGVGT